MFTRHSWIFTATLSAITFTFSSPTLSAQEPLEKPAASSPSAIEVAYMQFESTLLTFDVDRQTGFPTEVGQGVTLDAATDAVLLPSANDHFVYVTGYDSQHQEQLWVYATDTTGVPKLPAVQTLSLADSYGYTYDFIIDPNGTLAYAAESALNSQGETVAGIFKFTIDQATGMVTKSVKPVATYPPNGPCAPGGNAALNLYGFTPSGNRLCYSNVILSP